MTEHPTVVNGFVDVYQEWIDLGIDGFRIDTAKHVNFEFWEQWTTAGARLRPRRAGKPDFFMFGEVYDADPVKLSPVRARHRHELGPRLHLPVGGAELRHGRQRRRRLQSLFAGDDHYTTPDTSATALPTFLGNHDMGRIGYFLRDAGDVLERDELAHDLLFLSRGQPVVYYGDEQGFAGVGDGKDKNARQTLFASQVAEYQNQPLVTGETVGAVDRYADRRAAVPAHRRASQLRADHPALGDRRPDRAVRRPTAPASTRSRASTATRRSSTSSRVNNATTAQTVVAHHADGRRVVPAGLRRRRRRDDGRVGRGIRHRPCAVGRRVAGRQDRLGARRGRRRSPSRPPRPAPALAGSVAVSADVDDDDVEETSFAWRVVGSDDWTPLGTAEDTDPRVFHDIRGLANGTLVEYRAVSTDAAGQRSAASTYASVGNAVDARRGRGARGAVEPEPQEATPTRRQRSRQLQLRGGMPRRLAARSATRCR